MFLSHTKPRILLFTLVFTWDNSKRYKVNPRFRYFLRFKNWNVSFADKSKKKTHVAVVEASEDSKQVVKLMRRFVINNNCLFTSLQFPIYQWQVLLVKMSSWMYRSSYQIMNNWSKWSAIENVFSKNSTLISYGVRLSFRKNKFIHALRISL